MFSVLLVPAGAELDPSIASGVRDVTSWFNLLLFAPVDPAGSSSLVLLLLPDSSTRLTSLVLLLMPDSSTTRSTSLVLLLPDFSTTRLTSLDIIWNRIIIAPYDRNPRRLRRIVSGLLEIEGPADISRSFLSPITPIIRQIEGLSVRGDPGVNSEEQIEAPDTSILDWDFSPAPETPFRPRQTLSSTRMVFGTPITTTTIGISTTASATTSTNPLNSGTPETPVIPTLPSRNAHDINFRPIVFTSGSFTFTPSAPVTAIFVHQSSI
ncbi:hypothetical protein DMENIID0001_108880 [Sergentomyia squamirostris]